MVAQKVAFVVGPFAEETAKLVIVYILIKRYKITYGVQGLLVGAAVGVGFSVIESSGYAWNAYQEGLSKAGELVEQMQALNSNTSLDIWSIVSGSLTDNLILRGVTTIGVMRYGPPCTAEPWHWQKGKGSWVLSTWETSW